MVLVCAIVLSALAAASCASSQEQRASGGDCRPPEEALKPTGDLKLVAQRGGGGSRGGSGGGSAGRGGSPSGGGSKSPSGNGSKAPSGGGGSKASSGSSAPKARPNPVAGAKSATPFRSASAVGKPPPGTGRLRPGYRPRYFGSNIWMWFFFGMFVSDALDEDGFRQWADQQSDADLSAAEEQYAAMKDC